MKKVLFPLLMVVMGLQAYSQSPDRIVNLRSSYPIAVGSFFTDSFQYTHNGLDLCDIIQDSLPVYEIGHIFDQTVQYTEDGHGFYVKADSLHSPQVEYGYETDSTPRGPIEFNPTSGRFKYYPTAADYQSFYVLFYAISGQDTVWELVRFNLVPQVVPESYAFQNQGVLPTGDDYTIVAGAKVDSILFNTETRNVYQYSVAGKDVIFDDTLHNKVWGLSGREDIQELNIYAERLIIRSPLVFPQTNITIHAKEIVFEDRDSTILSINTSPTWIATLSNGVGLHGGNAGNIFLYANTVKGNRAKRFLMNGAPGQSTNRNGTPGNGGNGGTMTSNMNIAAYCDFARGSGGIKFDDDASATIIGSGNIGSEGHFVKEDTPYKYLHPEYIASVIRYVNDAYINNHTTYALQTCQAYCSEIDECLRSGMLNYFSTQELMELRNNLIELNSILNRLEQGGDFFGNSVGWAPLLSFEVMKTNYENEIARATPVLYLYYWLTKVEHTLVERVAAMSQMASLTEQEIQANQQLINALAEEIPLLEDKSVEIEGKITEVNEKIERLKAQLMAKARKKVKKKHKIAKAASICKAIASVASYCGPYGTAIGTALNVATNIASNVAYASGKLNIDADYTAFFPQVTFQTLKIDSILNVAKGMLGRTQLGSIGSDANYIQSRFDSINGAVTPLVNTFNDVRNALKHNSVSQSEIDQVFTELCAASPEWNALEADLNSLKDQKDYLERQINNITNSISGTISEISHDYVALDVFRRGAFENNSKRDLNAMQYIEKMAQRSKNRLLKYHYYMRKAYEYRMLKPYEGEHNLVNMYNRFDSLARNMSYDSIIDYSNYKTISSTFEESISGVVEEIIDEYNNNYPEQSAPVTIVIPREELEKLNNEGSMALNFYEMGIFAPDEENVRIVDLSVWHIETHTEGSIGYTGYMDLNLTHSGISRLRKDGQIFWFDHRTKSTTNSHTWGIRYDALSEEINPIQPSFASQSLLYSILERSNGVSNIMMFSRPSAWGDITLAKKVHTQGGGDIVIDTLVIRLQYDFIRRPGNSNLRNIDIATDEGLMPYIACSQPDIKGRSNGNGEMNRTYTVSNGNVTFSAIEQYGSYHFLNWTDRAGNVVSDSTALTVRRTTDQFYRANYERRVPILAVPDTIKVAHCGGPVTVQVLNVGSGDEEMDWYVDDSLSTWVHLDGIAEGIDSGFFTFLCDSNESGVRRVDSLEIYAPETDAMVKTIYIAQVDSAELLSIRQLEEHTPNTLRVHPNPANTSVTIEGRDIRWVTVYTTMGRKVLVIKMNGESHCTFGIDELPDGIYILDVATGNGPVRQKLVKSSR